MGEPDRQKLIPETSRDLKAAFDVVAEELSSKDLRYWSGLTPQTFYRYKHGKDVRFSTFQDLVNGLPQKEYEMFLSELLRENASRVETDAADVEKDESIQKAEIIALVSVFVSRCNFTELGELFSAISTALSQNPHNLSLSSFKTKLEKD